MKNRLLILILVLSACLRLYQIQKVFVFTIDEESQGNLAFTILNDFHLIWSGVGLSSGTFIGPLWTYLTVFILNISKDPVVFGVMGALIGVATTYALYYTGKTLFNKHVGFLSSLLYATLPLMVFFDQRYWNNSLVPLLSCLLVLSLIKSYGNQKWWFVFAAASGLVFHTHPSLVPLSFLGAIIFIQQVRRLSLKIILLSILTFLFLYSPLIVFDYAQNFRNFKALTLQDKNPTHGQAEERLHAHPEQLFETLGRLWYLKAGNFNTDEVHWECNKRTIPPKAISLFSLGFLLLFLLQKRTWVKQETRILALSLISFIGSFLLYPGLALEYYLLGFFPLFILTVSYQVVKLKNGLVKHVLITLLALLVLHGIFVVASANSDLSLKAQKDLVAQVSGIVGNEPFELEHIGKCRYQAGWRYLFKVWAVPPIKSTTDGNFAWLYPEEIKKDLKPVFKVIIAEDREPVYFDPGQVERVSSGGFTAYIIKN